MPTGCRRHAVVFQWIGHGLLRADARLNHKLENNIGHRTKRSRGALYDRATFRTPYPDTTNRSRRTLGELGYVSQESPVLWKAGLVSLINECISNAIKLFQQRKASRLDPSAAHVERLAANAAAEDTCKRIYCAVHYQLFERRWDFHLFALWDGIGKVLHFKDTI